MSVCLSLSFFFQNFFLHVSQSFITPKKTAPRETRTKHGYARQTSLDLGLERTGQLHFGAGGSPVVRTTGVQRTTKLYVQQSCTFSNVVRTTLYVQQRCTYNGGLERQIVHIGFDYFLSVSISIFRHSPSFTLARAHTRLCPNCFVSLSISPFSVALPYSLSLSHVSVQCHARTCVRFVVGCYASNSAFDWCRSVC